MRLHDLRAPKGAMRKRKRVGRGESSGQGKTCGAGMNGQKCRSGTGKPGLGFEGGQTPMFRRLPKIGFFNPFRKQWCEVNVDAFTSRFKSGAVVDLASLRQLGLARNKDVGLRVLGRGELGHQLTIRANHFSASAKKKIEAAGGVAELLEAPTKKSDKD